MEASPGLVYNHAQNFVREVESDREKTVIAAARAKAAFQVRREIMGPRPALKTVADFHADVRYGGDLSRADLAYAVYAIREGVSEDAIRSALASRDLGKKGGEARVADYIRRTLVKAAEEINKTPILPKGPNRVRELAR